jgi:alkylhydroperoxidase family enzyme
MLCRLGINTNTLKRFLATAQADFLDECEQALLRLVREANRNPHQVPPELLEEARAAGADDDNIIEAMSVMELYAGFNRLLDAFRIPIESEFADAHRSSL